MKLLFLRFVIFHPTKQNQGSVTSLSDMMKIFAKITGFKARIYTIKRKELISSGKYSQEMVEMYDYFNEYGYFAKRDPCIALKYFRLTSWEEFLRDKATVDTVKMMGYESVPHLKKQQQMEPIQGQGQIGPQPNSSQNKSQEPESINEVPKQKKSRQDEIMPLSKVDMQKKQSHPTQLVPVGQEATLPESVIPEELPLQSMNQQQMIQQAPIQQLQPVPMQSTSALQTKSLQPVTEIPAPMKQQQPQSQSDLPQSRMQQQEPSLMQEKTPEVIGQSPEEVPLRNQSERIPPKYVRVMPKDQIVMSDEGKGSSDPNLPAQRVRMEGQTE